MAELCNYYVVIITIIPGGCSNRRDFLIYRSTAGLHFFHQFCYMKYTVLLAKRIISFAAFIVSISGFAQAQISGLKLLGEYDVPYNLKYNNTTVGGLSGIDYDAAKKVYYLISDDRSAINPSRFYTAKVQISSKGIDSVYFTNVTFLKQKNGSTYPNHAKDAFHTPDPEAMRFNPATHQFIWSSEGERIVKHGDTLENPAITVIDTAGNYIDTFPLPAQLHMHATDNGPRQNGVFEGLTFADNYKTLFVNVEEPLYEDGPRAGLKDTATWIRILKYNIATKKLLAQYAYHPDPIPHAPTPAGAFMINGIPDILAIDAKHLLVMERAFSTGNMACTIKVYLADVSKASNIAGVASLQKTPAANIIAKKLLLNMDGLGRFIDNVEGITFGPALPNGHKTLIMVADNNFNILERSQFFLFEVIP